MEQPAPDPRSKVARRRLLAALTLGLLCVPLSAPSGTSGMQTPSHTPIDVIVFPGGFNWPIWAAEENGLFDRERLDVRLTPTPGSAF